MIYKKRVEKIFKECYDILKRTGGTKLLFLIR